MADTNQQKLDRFNAYYLNKGGDLKERTIQRWHLATDIYASGVFASGFFDFIKIDGPTTSGYVLTTDSNGWGTWQANDIADHSTLTNLGWATAGHIINSNVIPDTSGVRNLGSLSIPFASGYFNTLYGDGSNLTGLTTSFLGLTDTPNSYSSFAASGVRVNATQDGLEFHSHPVVISEHNLLNNLSWSSAGHIIDSSIVPNASGNLNVGSSSLSFNYGYFDNLESADAMYAKTYYGDGSNLTGILDISDHNLLNNLEWSVAGHTIDTNIMPDSSGSIDVGSAALSFDKGYFNNLEASTSIYAKTYYGDGSNLTGIDIKDSFLDLTDTPNSYSGMAASGVRVNSGENALEFYATSTGSSGSAITGEIKMWPVASIPDGFLLCDGSVVSQTTYAALYAVISSTYNTGGEGAGNFRLPNFKGKIGVGYNSAESDFNAIAKTGGETTHTLISSELADHGHKWQYAAGGGAGSPRNHIKDSSELATSWHSSNGTDNPPSWTDYSEIGDGGTGGAGMYTPMASTSGGAHNNLQPYVVINYIIKT